MTSNKQADTLMCNITVHRNAINLLYIPGHVTLRYVEVVPVAYVSDIIP